MPDAIATSVLRMDAFGGHYCNIHMGPRGIQVGWKPWWLEENGC